MKTENTLQAVDDKEVKIAQARVPVALHKAAGSKLYSEGLGFQWLIVEACKAYVGEESEPKSDIADRLMDWLRNCHKNPADYLAAEFACRRALGLKREDWEEFQKGLRK